MAFSPSLNNITGSKPQGYKVPGKNYGKPAMVGTALSKAVGKKVKKATPAMRQYGDKGYKPSTGKGVGY